jgi:gliding motility-associated-like protein/uncharacterized repeat protein (TIGR01451 family)
MKHLQIILLICILLVIANTGYSQTSATPVTYKITQGSSIVLHGNSNYAAAYQWYRDSIAISGAITMNYTADTTGTYSVIAFNSEGCPSQQSAAVDVIVIPAAPLVAKIDTPVDLSITIKSTQNTKIVQGGNFSYIITATNNSTTDATGVEVTFTLPAKLSYIAPMIGDTTVSFNSTTRTLTWNINNLSENDSMNLTVNVSVLQSGTIQSTVNILGTQPDPLMANNAATNIQQVNQLIIPNVFTPNGDGVNDTFYIPGLDTYPENEITIMNRAGNIVYTKNNYQGDWGGNGLVEGTYFYLLKVKSQTGEWDSYKGYVTLLRSRM